MKFRIHYYKDNFDGSIDVYAATPREALVFWKASVKYEAGMRVKKVKISKA